LHLLGLLAPVEQADGALRPQPGLDQARALPAPAGHGGRGLIGLRERVAVYRGELDTGPRPGGGWRVSAKIPLEPAADGQEQARPDCQAASS